MRALLDAGAAVNQAWVRCLRYDVLAACSDVVVHPPPLLGAFSVGNAVCEQSFRQLLVVSVLVVCSCREICVGDWLDACIVVAVCRAHCRLTARPRCTLQVRRA